MIFKFNILADAWYHIAYSKNETKRVFLLSNLIIFISFQERNLWQQTLKVTEHISDQKTDYEYTAWDFQVATWILLAICVLLIIVILCILIAIILSRRRKEYPSQVPTLRSNKKRESTYEPSNMDGSREVAIN